MLAADDNQIVSVYQAILYQINRDIAISYWILALAKLWCLMCFAPHMRIWISSVFLSFLKFTCSKFVIVNAA